MAELAVRLLRDGALEGQSAAGLLVADTVAAAGGGRRVFRHLLQRLGAAVSAGRAQAKWVPTF